MKCPLILQTLLQTKLNSEVFLFEIRCSITIFLIEQGKENKEQRPSSLIAAHLCVQRNLFVLLVS